MQTAAVGATGVRVTRLGLGGAPLGGLFTRVSDEDAEATVHAAWERGIRFFDTAPLYGHGRSEARLGQALKAWPRSAFTLSSKVGRVLVPAGTPSGGIYDDPWPFEPVFDFSRDGIRRSLDGSLKRLGVDYVDILHLHDPDDHYRQALDEAVPALLRLKEEGVTRAVSAGMNQWQMLAEFARAAPFDGFLLAGRYSLLDQGGAAELLPLCQERNIAVLLGGVFNSGVLAAGSAGAGAYDYAAPPPEVLARVRRLEAVCARFDVPLKAAALQFPLAHPAVTALVVGARSPDEVGENVRLLEEPAPADFWRALQREGLIDEALPVPR
jgi:D-threo-aldose 1-dehydrogenase